MADIGRALGGGLGAASKILDWQNQRRQMADQFGLQEQLHQRGVQEMLMEAAIKSVVLPKALTEWEEKNIRIPAENKRVEQQRLNTEQKHLNAIEAIDAAADAEEQMQRQMIEDALKRKEEGLTTVEEDIRQKQVDAYTKQADASMLRAKSQDEYYEGMIEVNKMKSSFMSSAKDWEKFVMPHTSRQVESILDMADKQAGQHLMLHPNDPNAAEEIKKYYTAAHAESTDLMLRDYPITYYMTNGKLPMGFVKMMSGWDEKKRGSYLLWMEGENPGIYLEMIAALGDKQFYEAEKKRLGGDEAEVTMFNEESFPYENPLQKIQNEMNKTERLPSVPIK